MTKNKKQVGEQLSFFADMITPVDELGNKIGDTIMESVIKTLKYEPNSLNNVCIYKNSRENQCEMACVIKDNPTCIPVDFANNCGEKCPYYIKGDKI